MLFQPTAYQNFAAGWNPDGPRKLWQFYAFKIFLFFQRIVRDLENFWVSKLKSFSSLNYAEAYYNLAEPISEPSRLGDTTFKGCVRGFLLFRTQCPSSLTPNLNFFCSIYAPKKNALSLLNQFCACAKHICQLLSETLLIRHLLTTISM